MNADGTVARDQRRMLLVVNQELTAAELHRMRDWVDGRKITPLHFDTKEDFGRFVVEQREAGWEIMTPEDLGLSEDSFPGDFYFMKYDSAGHLGVVVA